MTVAPRSLMKPALALAAAGAVALGPVVASPSAPAPAIPAVHVENVALAGWFTDTVLYWGDIAANSAIAAINPIPIIGPPIATQIDINWYAGLRPLAAVTSAYVSSIFYDPLGIVVHTVNYASNLGYIGYNYIGAQLSTIGIWVPPIPPPPPVAAVAPARTATLAAAARSAAAPGESSKAARPAASQARQSPRAAAAVAEADDQAPAQAPQTATPRKAKADRAEARSSARAASASRR